MLTIGKAAAQAEVTIDTVRFYERSGLLGKARRTASGYRMYDATDVARLRFIRRAKALGFSLDEIAELLALNDGTGRRSSVRSVAQRRLAEIEQRIADLERVRRTLAGLVRKCHGDGELPGCPIIESLLGDGDAACSARKSPARTTTRQPS